MSAGLPGALWSTQATIIANIALGERWVVLELVNPDIPIDKPWRHIPPHERSRIGAMSLVKVTSRGISILAGGAAPAICVIHAIAARGSSGGWMGLLVMFLNSTVLIGSSIQQLQRQLSNARATVVVLPPNRYQLPQKRAKYEANQDRPTELNLLEYKNPEGRAGAGGRTHDQMSNVQNLPPQPILLSQLLSSKDTVVAVALFVIVAIAHALSLNATPFDSRWTVPIAVSILHQGNTDLNEYLPLLQRENFYVIDCVLPGGGRVYPVKSVADCAGGRFYHLYPIAIPILVLPAVWTLETGIRAAQPFLGPTAMRAPSAVLRAFLSGDMVGGAMTAELLIASVVVAVASVIIFLFARRYLATAPSALLALVFAFCTPAWSTASRALWQHGFSMLLLALALLALHQAGRHPGWIAMLGATAALAFYVRPTNAVAFAAFFLFAARRNRKDLLIFLAGAAPIAIAFSIYDLHIYGTLLAPYSYVRRGAVAGDLGYHPAMLEALAGHLISPARGLLIYSPIFLLSIAGMLLKPPGELARQLRLYLIAIVIGHWILISSFANWSGGHCFGPRYFSDMAPIFIWFLIPVLLRSDRRLQIAFAALAALSFFIHYQGATQWATMQWNVDPVNVDSHPERIWDWRDPQFLRAVRTQARF